VNHYAKFHAASFILGGEIRNRKSKKQTVTDISTPCLSACVDKKNSFHIMLMEWLDLKGCPVLSSRALDELHS